MHITLEANVKWALVEELERELRFKESTICRFVRAMPPKLFRLSYKLRMSIVPSISTH